MPLPARLQAVIAEQAARYSTASLARAAAELSEQYRQPHPPALPVLTTDIHRAAYMVVRLPATFAAVRAVLQEVRRRLPDLKAGSLLDLGAGPGTVAWAAVEVFDELQQITLLERDRDLLQLGRSAASEAEHPALRAADWQAQDYRAVAQLPPHDLVVCSYTLGEGDEATASKVQKSAWLAARQVLAVIEPGTIRGFGLIRQLRDEMIEAGGCLLAPCPHAQACPMSADDWCHFSQRFDRSSLHRRIKNASLGYEDEKYSWFAAARIPAPSIGARVIRHPLRQSGYIRLELCTNDGLSGLTVTRRNREDWKRARKTDWGDVW